jgi:hypothetical protein
MEKRVIVVKQVDALFDKPMNSLPSNKASECTHCDAAAENGDDVVGFMATTIGEV